MSLSFLSADEAVKQLIMSQSSTVEVCEIDQKLTPCRTFGDFWGIITSQGTDTHTVNINKILTPSHVASLALAC